MSSKSRNITLATHVLKLRLDPLPTTRFLMVIEEQTQTQLQPFGYKVTDSQQPIYGIL